jgi:hypothetical protein
MRLPRPFFRLPVRFDAARLRAEVEAIPAAAWVEHPNGLAGNSAVRLISADGAETDGVHGRMLATPWLAASPYIRQVLSSFGVVWSRSRLMRLAPGAEVPEHADINYHWHTRVRMHIPVITRPEVRFHCGEETVHMAAGEAWLFDNWRLHRVENPAPEQRIHLVADTTGTANFWQLALRAPATPPQQWPVVGFRPEAAASPLTETNQRAAILPAAEVQLLINDLRAELVAARDTTEARGAVAAFSGFLEGFICDWRQLCALHGTQGAGREEFRRLATNVREAARTLGDGLVMRTNHISAVRVLEARVLQHLVADEGAQGATTRRPGVHRPVIIVAAPRSGSTLLFETLACSPAFNTLGGEAHWLVEDHAALRPGASGVESNRLTAEHATPGVAEAIRGAAEARLQGPNGAAPAVDGRLLEKTPKNSLRIPFLDRVFPDAQYIFLWRDPRENLASIIEAWRAGRWITYPSLPGRNGPWSLLLPPEWQQLRDAPLEQIAARQWLAANQTIADDLTRLPRERWTAVSFAEFLLDPAATVRRLCGFLGVEFDAALAQRTAAPLPHSRYTNTPPAPGKWRANAAAIERMLPDVESCWQRLRSLD